MDKCSKCVKAREATFLQHVKAQVYARGLFGRLWRCRFLRFLERPRAEPLWSSDAAALAAVDIPVTAEFASALTAASSMGALAACCRSISRCVSR